MHVGYEVAEEGGRDGQGPDDVLPSLPDVHVEELRASGGGRGRRQGLEEQRAANDEREHGRQQPGADSEEASAGVSRRQYHSFSVGS